MKYVVVILCCIFVLHAEHGENVGSFCMVHREILSSQTFSYEKSNGDESFSPQEVLNVPSFITYYDNQHSTSYSFKVNKVFYNFVIAQFNKNVWAINIGTKYNGLAVQITDFAGVDELDWTTELYKSRNKGIFFCRTKEIYSAKDKPSTYKIKETANNVIAIDMRNMLKDIIKGLPSLPGVSDNIKKPNVISSIKGLNSSSYFVSVKRFKRQSGARFSLFNKASSCGWGVVCDPDNKYLYVATTNLTSIPVNGGTVKPEENYIERIDIRSIDFSKNREDLPSKTVFTANTDDVLIAHLMINPWDPTKMAIDNYAAYRRGDTDTEPSKLTIIDFSHKPTQGEVIYCKLPSERSDKDDLNQITHASFCGPDHIIFSHMNWDQAYVANYCEVKETMNNYIAFTELFRFDMHGKRQGVPHAAMSSDGRFIVSDRGRKYKNRADDLRMDTLYLWFSENDKPNCIPIVKDINATEGNPHPHASFIDDENGDNRIIIFNNYTKRAVWSIRIPDKLWKKDLDDFRELTAQTN